jgi:hypothetical protein
MRLRFTATLLLLPLVGCAGNASLTASCDGGFVNNSVATTAELQADWKAAQTAIATQPIAMNPVSGKPYTDPPNPAALTVEPSCQVKVKGMPNALPLPKAGFPTSASPTGYAAGETLGSDPWTVEVVEPSLNTFYDAAAQWEFQNVILEQLGYDVQGR